MFIDTHCHLSIKDYDDIEKVIKEADYANVKKIIISGCDKDSIKEAVEISKKYENVYLSLGYHPSEANIINNQDIDELRNIIVNTDKIVAIGEIGLDYHWDKENKDKQKKLFKDMLFLAKEVNLPVIIHSRDAFQDTYDILKESEITGVIHCFSGNIENARKYIKLGFYLGIGGVLTFKNTNLKEVIKDIDLKNVVLETDSPYLAPVPYRGMQNSPKYIPIVAKEISILKNISIEEVAKITTETAMNIFKNM